MKVIKIGAFEAKTHLSQLLEKVRSGQIFVVTKRGEPVAQLGPIETPGRHPVYGSAKGRIHIEPDFDAPLADLREYME